MDIGRLGKDIDYEMNKLDVQSNLKGQTMARQKGQQESARSWVLDVSNLNQNGQTWDFSNTDMRNAAIKLLTERRPQLVVGAGLGRHRDEQAQRRHAEFMDYVYKHQARVGRLFMHAVRVGLETSLLTCMHDGGALSVKNARYQETVLQGTTETITNSAYIAVEIGRRKNRAPEMKTEKKSDMQEFCSQVCRGMRRQVRADTQGAYLLGSISASSDNPCRARKVELAPEEQEDVQWVQYWDNISGQPLKTEKVSAARVEEVGFIRKSKLYDIVPIAESFEKTGKKPIAGRWLDSNKGDAVNEKYRSRWVAKDFNRGANPEMFAATPPLEALRVLLSKAATGRRGFKAQHPDDDQVILIMDVSRAFFYAPVGKPTYVEVPDEEGVDKTLYCGRLNFSLYGTREAPRNWHKTYSKQFEGMGYEQGTSSPCLFFHKGKDIPAYVHGDDYAVTGTRREMKALEKEIKKTFDIKAEYLGPREYDMKEVRLLNRVIRYTDKGIEYEADPRHQEIIISELGLTGAKSLSSPGTRDMPKTPDCDEDLQGAEATKYRAVCARINFLALDRPDLMYSAKEGSRAMSQPKQGDWQRLKRIGRYLVGQPRLIVKYRWQDSYKEITGTTQAVLGFSDSDWAGCPKSRRSTSGGSIMLGSHWIKSWSRTQATVALSSGEAELYAMIKASSEVLGVQSLMKDWGIKLSGQILGDASACLGVIRRQGLGKLRHVNTSYLWVQEKAANKELVYDKVLGAWNPADLMTKYLNLPDIEKHMKTMELYFQGGRAESAPQVVSSEAASVQSVQIRMWPVASHRHRVKVASSRSRTSVYERLTLDSASRGGVRVYRGANTNAQSISNG